MSDQRSIDEPSRTSPASGTEENEEAGRSGAEKQSKKGYDIDIFRGWCKACGICAAFCPKHCITLDENGSPVVVSSEQCSGCGWCEIHCPDFAISVRETKSPRIVAEDE